MEQGLAEAIRPLAEHLAAVQERGDLQHYDDRFSSERQAIASSEQLQGRSNSDWHGLDHDPTKESMWDK